MARLGSSNEIVVRAVHALDHGAEPLDVAVDQLARRHPLFGGGLLDLLAVFVGTGEEKNIIAVEAHETRNRVRGDRLVGMSDMRCAVGVGNCGGNKERTLCHSSIYSLS